MKSEGSPSTKAFFGPQMKEGDTVTVEVDTVNKNVSYYRNQARKLADRQAVAVGNRSAGVMMDSKNIGRWVGHTRVVFGGAVASRATPSCSCGCLCC